MNTTYIMEFLALAKSSNFQETAFEMCISQSSLSKHIKILENELGTELFTRTTRSVKLNEYGKLFYEFALQFAQLNDEFLSAKNLMQLSDHQKLTIAYHPALEPYQVIETITDFSAKHPEISVHLIEDRNPLTLLYSHSCNIAFDSPLTPVAENVEVTPFKKDYLVVVLSQDHPFASDSSFPIQQIRHENFITYMDTLNELQHFYVMCQELQFMPHTIAKTIFRSNAIKTIAQGVGISVMNLQQLKFLDHKGVAAVRLNPQIDFNIDLFRMKDHKKSASESAFYKYIKSLP